MANRRFIPFSKIEIGEDERAHLLEVLNSGWLTTAEKSCEFEKRFAEYIGVNHACAVNSCTAALHLAVEAIGIKSGDKVFVPTMTFTASAEILRYVDAHPVFLDVEYGSNLITSEILLAAIRKFPEVKFIIIVHFGGQPAQMEELLKICRRFGIRIIEDAAHAFPSRIGGRYIGTFGDITCFSFYANKTITTGEGGMLVTNNEELYQSAKIMRLHGINKDVWSRYITMDQSWEYDVVAAGYKYNMPDITAAIGLGQLANANVFRIRRQKVAEYYFEKLAGLISIDLPLIHIPFEHHSWHLFPIVLNEHSRITRKDFFNQMLKEGIGLSVHYKPLHRMTYYSKRYELSTSNYPNAEKTWIGNISLPIYPLLEIDELEYICNTIYKILD